MLLRQIAVTTNTSLLQATDYPPLFGQTFSFAEPFFIRMVSAGMNRGEFMPADTIYGFVTLPDP